MNPFRLVFLLASSLAAQVEHQHHPPRDAAEYLKVLEDPKRDAWQTPHQVITALDLKSTDVVADIGSGSGYFTRRFALHAGKVYAVDIDQRLLDSVKKNSPPNVVPVLAAPDDPKLPAASVDVIFFCNVLHHIENRPAYLRKLKSALKPGGRIVNVDFYKKPLPVGPNEKMKLSEEEVEKDFAAAGLRKVRQIDSLQYQYFLVFEPQPQPAAPAPRN